MKEFLNLLKRFLPPYKWYLTLSVLFNLLSAVLTLFSFALIIPILEMLFKVNSTSYEFMAWGSASVKTVAVNNFYYYVSQAIEQWGESTALLLLAAGLVVMTLLKTGTAYLSSYYLIPIRSGVVRDVRNLMYDKIVRLPMGFFTEERKGDVMARMSGDVVEVENSIMASLDILFRNPIMVVACLAMMIAVSWELTLFVLLLLPIAGWVMGTVGKNLKKRGVEGQNQWGVLLSTIEETLGGLRIVKAFNAEEKVKARFHDENESLFSINNRIQRRYMLAHPMSEFLGTATIAIVLWFGGTLILGGNSSITAAEFIYYMVIFYSIINPIKETSRGAYSVQKGLASMERINKILLADNPITDPAEPVEIQQGGSHDIEYRGVSFRYGAEWVLRDVSLTIPHGATVALVGQSGSGKSTLADLLPRFYDVEQGAVLIDSIDIRNYRVHDLRSLMGNVNQEAILFNDTFFNNIAFGVESASRDEVEQAARIANAYDFIVASEKGFDTNIGDRGCKLSGGQRQRISIAREGAYKHLVDMQTF